MFTRATQHFAIKNSCRCSPGNQVYDSTQTGHIIKSYWRKSAIGLTDLSLLRLMRFVRGRFIWEQVKQRGERVFWTSRKKSEGSKLVTSKAPVERWQWRRYSEAEQQFGNRTTVYEVDDGLFNRFIKPKLSRAGAGTLAEYKAKYPSQSHISFTQIGGEETEVLRGYGALEELRPRGGHVEWARLVASFESVEAREWGRLCDPEQEPLNVEKDLMRDLGFKNLRDLEEWLNLPTPPEVLAKLGTTGNWTRRK